MRTTGLVILLTLIATIAFGQVTVGSLPNNAILNFGFRVDIPTTTLDLSHPANGSGNLSTLTLRWSGNTSCNAAFNVTFLRVLPQAPNTYNTIATRGPFQAGAGESLVTVPLSPSVPIQGGDYIAVTGFAGCGAPDIGETSSSLGALMTFNGILPSSGSLNGKIVSIGAMAARASSDVNVLDGVVAAVGSVTGGNGSSFRTSMQLSNPDVVPIQGTLVFHPAATTASSSDPSLSYSLVSRASISYADVIASLNASGLGSLDLVTTSSPPPIVTTRVFNDQGSAGTSGFTEPALSPASALNTGDFGFFNEPFDLTNYRMNIGIRTLSQGATVVIRHFDPSGNQVGNPITKTYAASYFEQVPLATFLGGGAPIANGLVRVAPSAGSIIVYASTTDNRTNDSSVFFLTRPQ